MEVGHNDGVKRVKTAFVVLLAALAGVIGWQVAKVNDEPAYRGKRLTAWLTEIRTENVSPETGQREPCEADEAIRELGTNGIPTMLRLLRVRDSALKVKLMALLDRQNVVQVEFTPAEDWNLAAMLGLLEIRSNAQSAIPGLIAIIDENVSESSFRNAVNALEAIPCRPLQKGYVPALKRWLTNADPPLRSYAYYQLLDLDPKAAAEAGISAEPR